MRKQCAAFLLAPHDLLISQFSLGLLLIVLIALADCIGPTVSFAQLRRLPPAGRAQYAGGGAAGDRGEGALRGRDLVHGDDARRLSRGRLEYLQRV